MEEKIEDQIPQMQPVFDPDAPLISVPGMEPGVQEKNKWLYSTA